MRVVRHLFALVAGAGLLVAVSSSIVIGCPFCPGLGPTLVESAARPQHVCLAKWVAARAASEHDPGNTTYAILRVAKSANDDVKAGDQFTLTRFRPGKQGDVFLLLGIGSGKGDSILWESATEFTKTAFDYLVHAPATDVPRTKRLAYFVGFLESSDRIISNDAYTEFANAAYQDIAAVAPLLSRQKIRQWIASPETSQPRLGVYGMLLGLCGNAEDADLLARTISQNPETFRIGIDGMTGGYLLLTGSAGLDRIDEWKFKDPKVPFSEIYATLNGLRFMWQFGAEKIPQERLRASLRLLLDRPQLTDMVLTDLARWNDWSIQDRMMALYGKGEFNTRPIKRAIVCFLVASAQSKSAAAAQGKKYLDALRKKDPKLVKEAERFFPN